MMKKIIVLVIAILLVTIPAFAGRVSDYTFKDGEDNVIVANRNAEKKIALTFDDGPSLEYTREILGILKEYNAKATFFVIGENAKKHPKIILEEIAQGHEIGNHTYTHRNLRSLSADEIEQEIEKTQSVIKDITGKAPELFRPPGGYLNNVIVNKIALNNCKTVLWSWRQDTKDWQKPAVDQVVNTVIKNLKDGDIILFHDFISKESPTPRALRIILPMLKERGYSLVTVSELINE